ncbi:MAG TPA: peptidoglycan-binding protein, partial [Clostridia bacterium]|nr:peptidoglycan-binding protein [Clostridia bacterium]
MSKRMTTRICILALVTLMLLGQVFTFTSHSNAASSTVTQTLRQGSRGSQVKILQQKLNSLGFNAGDVDGSFGPKTRAAVLAFQKAYELARDGVVGPATRAKLNPGKPKDSKPQDPKPADPKPETSPAKDIPQVTQTLKRGSKGTQVKYLQQRLNALGFNVGEVDGSFGPKTLAGVHAFQKANGLAVDGSVGPATRAKLNAAIKPPKPEEPKPEKPKPEEPKPEKPKPKEPKPEKPKPETPPAKEIPPVTQTLRRGDKGTQVKNLQEKLNYLGFDVGEVDGS